jgi:hypothetical protein
MTQPEPSQLMPTRSESWQERLSRGAAEVAAWELRRAEASEAELASPAEISSGRQRPRALLRWLLDVARALPGRGGALGVALVEASACDSPEGTSRLSAASAAAALRSADRTIERHRATLRRLALLRSAGEGPAARRWPAMPRAWPADPPPWSAWLDSATRRRGSSPRTLPPGGGRLRQLRRRTPPPSGGGVKSLEDLLEDGRPGASAAAEAAERLRSLGLEPLGGGGSR